MNTDSLNNISCGLYVLTASDNGIDNGCIINTLAQLTSSPLQIGVTVSKETFTHDMVAKTGIFNASVIDTSADFELIKHFGFQSGKDKKKFGTADSYRYEPRFSENGLIYLSTFSNAYVSGKVTSSVDLGTHTMFIADMTDGEILSDKPTMTYDYYHKNVKPKVQTKKSGWICKVCGYIYEGEELPKDYICPICKHGAEDFERIG